jgi:hypothetical protein
MAFCNGCGIRLTALRAQEATPIAAFEGEHLAGTAGHQGDDPCAAVKIVRRDAASCQAAAQLSLAGGQ